MNIDKKEQIRIKRMISVYNMFVNIFWSVLNLTPISVYCYKYMHLRFFSTLLAISLSILFLPRSFFTLLQLSNTTGIYRKMGVHLINKYTQNGDIINGIIRRRIPGYKVVSNRNSSIKKLLVQTIVYEKFHLTMFVFFAFSTAYALLNSQLSWAFIIGVNNLVYNVYPALLQQYIRLKLGSFS